MKETRASKTRQRTRIGKPMRKSLFDNPLARINARGFTLVELLVVVSIIAVLLAILLPVAGRVRGQARGVVCQSNERQWGLAFLTYCSAHDGKFFRSLQDIWLWPYKLHSYVSPGPDTALAYQIDLLLCPAAARHPVENDSDGMDSAFGGRDRAWELVESVPPAGRLFGSYGFNYGVTYFYSDSPIEVRKSAPQRALGGPATTPVLLDCTWHVGHGTGLDTPPAYEGDMSGCTGGNPGMKPYCINRHHAHTNALFLDWSVRKVGLKELWTLTWLRDSDAAGPWTKAGGVRPEDWPMWMRKFRDY
jgi:prepilin-type N-terminal cleavage/methylation domain-containing protein